MRPRWRGRFKWKLRNAIFVSFMGIVVASLLLQTFLFQSLLRNQIRQESIADNEAGLTHMMEDFSTFLREASTEMLSLYSETDLITDLRRAAQMRQDLKHLEEPPVLGSRADDTQARALLLGEQIRGILRKYYWRNWYVARKRFPVKMYLRAMYLYDPEDQVISTYRYNCQHFPLDIYRADYDMNQEILLDYAHSDRTNLMITGYYNPSEKQDMVRLVLKLHNYDEERLYLGYLVCELDGRVLTDIMKKYASSSDVFLWIQPAGDQPVVSIGKVEGEKESTFRQVSDMVENDYGNLSLKDEYESAYLVHVSLAKYQLQALGLIPQSLMTAAQKSQNETMLVLSFVMMLVTAALAGMITKWISKPVEGMRDTILRIQKGEGSLRIKPEGWAEELMVLGNEFNEMLDRIEQMVADEYEYKLLVERTEYKMLQAQINPHFLYNTLNTMSAIANAQGCPLVSGLCQSLSAIFRYCLDMSDELSTVEKEIAHARNYLYVMDVRNGGSISFEYQVENETLQDRLPRITLQPIVENAINHGLRNVRRKDKLLRIGARHEGEDLVVTVEDNGIGMDADALNLELMKADAKRVESGVSIGVLNVNARLKKAFGPSYGIHVYSVPGEGTRVEIRTAIRSVS